MNRRTVSPLSKEEEQILLQMFRNHPKARIRERAMMVLLSSQGLCVVEIAEILGRNENTVSTQLNAYEAEGFLGLYDKPIPGRPGQLSKEQMQQIESWLDDSPRKQGYQQSNWTLKMLRHHIFRRFKLRLSLSRVWQIVHSLGFVQIRPRHYSIVPTEEQIAQAFKLILECLNNAKNGEYILFFLDETLATVWATLCACWARKGTRPEIPMGNDHGRVYVFAAADPLRGRIHYRIAPNQNKENLLAFLKQMRTRYPKEKLVFILDNAKPHKAKIVEQFIQQDGNMQLAFLPAYTSIKCNPIERLFKWFRRVVTHNEYFEDLKQLKNAIQAFFRAVANLPRRIIALLNQNLDSFV